MSSEILQKIEELYKSNGLNCCDEELIHEACIHKNECWTEASIKERGNEINKMPLPYIGDKFKGDLLCIGLNFNDYGGKKAHYNLIDDEANGVKRLLTDGKIKINFNLARETYAGTFLFHRMSVYANIILGYYKYEDDKILSLDDRILYYSKDYLAKIYSELIFLNAIKCSPKYKNSEPFEPMYVNCFNNILCNEIKIIKPKNILVFHKDVSGYIKIKFGCTNNIRKQNMEYYKTSIENTPVDVYRVVHPSRGNSVKLITELHDLKQEVSL